MLRYLIAVGFALLLLCTPAYGQELPPDPAPAVAEDVADPVADAKAEYTELVDGDVKVKDVITNGTEVYDAVQALRKEKEETGKINMVLILLMLAAIFKALLSVAKVVGKLVGEEFWKNRKGKTIMRLICIGLGLATMVTAKLAAGVGWGDAILLFLSGPGALAAHEVTGLFVGMKDDKDEPAEESPG